MPEVRYKLIDEDNNPLEISKLEPLKPIAAEISHIKVVPVGNAGDFILDIHIVAIKPEGRSYSVTERGRIKAAYRKRTENN